MPVVTMFGCIEPLKVGPAKVSLNWCNLTGKSTAALLQAASSWGCYSSKCKCSSARAACVCVVRPTADKPTCSLYLAGWYSATMADDYAGLISVAAINAT